MIECLSNVLEAHIDAALSIHPDLSRSDMSFAVSHGNGCLRVCIGYDDRVLDRGYVPTDFGYSSMAKFRKVVVKSLKSRDLPRRKFRSLEVSDGF